MRINIRRNGKYLDVSVSDCGTTIELGLLDSIEAHSLADTLQEAIDEIFEEMPRAEKEGQQ